MELSLLVPFPDRGTSDIVSLREGSWEKVPPMQCPLVELAVLAVSISMILGSIDDQKTDGLAPYSRSSAQDKWFRTMPVHNR